MIRIIFLTLLFIFTLKAEIKNELFILPSQNSEIEDRIYNTKDFDRNIVIDNRTKVVAKKITQFLKES